jgi:hypothetical protein
MTPVAYSLKKKLSFHCRESNPDHSWTKPTSCPYTPFRPLIIACVNSPLLCIFKFLAFIFIFFFTLQLSQSSLNVRLKCLLAACYLRSANKVGRNLNLGAKNQREREKERSGRVREREREKGEREGGRKEGRERGRKG